MKALLTGAALALALSGAAAAQSSMPAQDPTPSTMPAQTPVPSTMPAQTTVPSTMPNANQTPEAPADGTMPNANGTVTSGGAVHPDGTTGTTETMPADPNCPAGTTPANGTACPPPPATH